jgi:tetratricopeptide (TPR) repeat protein
MQPGPRFPRCTVLACFRTPPVVHALLRYFWGRSHHGTCAPREPVTIFAPSMARLCLLLVVLSVASPLAVAPLRADARSDAKKQIEFGISVAQRGLWREAIYRWERAAEIDPNYAAAHNNLAIGYEHEGEMEKARAAYEKALELEPNNSLIKQNYELFKEINDRTTRQDSQ